MFVQTFHQNEMINTCVSGNIADESCLSRGGTVYADKFKASQRIYISHLT